METPATSFPLQAREKKFAAIRDARVWHMKVSRLAFATGRQNWLTTLATGATSEIAKLVTVIEWLDLSAGPKVKINR